MKKDKARDIARGVLPSTARKGARDNKREYHAKHRGAQRQVNHAIARHCATVSDHGTIVTDPDLFDDFEDLDTFDGYHAATKKPSVGWDDMNEIVSNRRGADKLGPLLSWARAIEKNKMDGWSVEDKIAYFKAVLPDSLQGRHALGHVKQALDLVTDEFLYGVRYRYRPDPTTKDGFRAALSHRLSTSKGRIALHEFMMESVPVAAHRVEVNNKVKASAPAVNADGSPRYVTKERYSNGKFRPVTFQPTCDVYVPQIVSVTCDDCSFLRNDPLATTQAVNRFVEIIWNNRGRYDHFRRRRIDPNKIDHNSYFEIFNYICKDD